MKLNMHSSTLLFALGCYPSLCMGVDGNSGLRKLPAKTTSIECDVQLAVGQIEEEGPPQEILHCSFDQPDDLGNMLYEVKGLVDEEFERIKKTVTTTGATKYEFPGATRSKGKPASQSSLFGENTPATMQSINVQKHIKGKPQAIEKGGGKDKDKTNNGKGHRSLYNLQGVSKVLAVRFVALDAETTHSANDCRAHTFGGYDDQGVLDDMNMKSQIDACSYGKLKFVEPEDDPAYPDVVGGVVTVTLNQTVAGVSHGTVLGWARETTPLYAGPLDQYDHVMYFMPPGVAFRGAAAFGYMPGRETWYHDSYSLSTGIQLHELGHNLGLGHSGEDGGEYGDSSCYMGYGGGDDRMCYNAAKSWDLGWYSEFHQQFDPVEESSKLFKLVGLSDYNEALAASDPSAFTIVLRIETFEQESIYLTYNHQKGVNIDTKEFQDKVTVVRADGRKQSWAEAGLEPGQRYSRSIVDGSGRALEIAVCERVYGSPDYAVVSVHPFGSAPLCTLPSPIPSWETYEGDLHDGLIAHYTFDGDYLDTAGNRFHAFEFGNPTFTSDGAVGQALSFDGVDDYVELPNIPELDFGTGDFTLTFWYRVSGDQVGKPAIIGNKDFRSPSNVGWAVSSNYGSGSNGDDLAINLSDGNTIVDSSKATDVGFNTWHFVAIRVKRGDKMSLLRSDKSTYVLQEDSVNTLTGSFSTGNNIRIGSSHQDCGASFTKMDLDDLGVWSRALSSEEINQIWMASRKTGFNIMQANLSPNGSDSARPSGMVAKYDLEGDFSDSTLNDLAGVLTDGGGMVFQSSTEGYFMNLNNVDFAQKTFVTLPSSSLLDFGTEAPFSVAVWMRTTTDFSSGGPSIISNKDWNSGYNPGWTIGIGSNGRYEFNVGDGSVRCDYDGPAGALNDGEWHHLAFSMTRGADGLLTLFLDGKIVDQKSCAVNSVSTPYPTVIGTDGRGGASYPKYYSGDLDKVVIFSSALNHAQLLELYAQRRSDTATFAPSASPTTAAPTESPTSRPTASPVTASPTPGPSGPFFITNPSSGKVLTIDGGVCGDGANIIPGTNNEDNWQKWMLNYDKTIESAHCPGLVIGFEGTSCSNSVSVVLATKSGCDDGQVWMLREDSVIVNAKCDSKAIDISGGTNIILWSIHAGSNQLWELQSAAAPPSVSPTTTSPTVTSRPTASPVTASPTPGPSGPFFITNPSSGKVLTIDGGVCGDGANIIPGTNTDSNWQKWMINYDKTIESAHCPGLVIGFEGTSCSNSVSVVLATKNGWDDGQVWMLREDGVIVNAKCDTKAIDISGGSLGTNIILWSIHGGGNQQWELLPTEAATSTNAPSKKPTDAPVTQSPITSKPSESPSASPTTLSPSNGPTVAPSNAPSQSPITPKPSASPSTSPTTLAPSKSPSQSPSLSPSKSPSSMPSQAPSTPNPSISPTSSPTDRLALGEPCSRGSECASDYCAGRDETICMPEPTC